MLATRGPWNRMVALNFCGTIRNNRSGIGALERDCTICGPFEARWGLVKAIWAILRYFGLFVAIFERRGEI